jgi:transposase
MGHQVKLVPAQHVTPFVRGNKNDANDVVGITEAAVRPNIWFVPIKTINQQDIQMIHRIRERHVADRTALVNQIRGQLSDYGIIMPKGWRKMKDKLPLILEDAENQLTPIGRECVASQYEELRTINEMIAADEKRLKMYLKDNEDYNRLLEIPGFGPIVASAFVAAIGQAKQFRNARHMAAWLGITPRQMASGDKSVMLGITKRGSRSLRTMIIHGARAVVSNCEHKTDALSLWIKKLIERRGKNKAIVALAHKLTRFAWVILNRQEHYQAPVLST